MNIRVASILCIFVAAGLSPAVSAQESRDVANSNLILDIADDYKKSSDAIVLFTANTDHNLLAITKNGKIFQGTLSILEGQEFDAKSIVMPPESFTRNIRAGETVKIYLKKYRLRSDLYYPITILPYQQE